MTITYEIGNSLYLNITNKCPCDCTFCIRRLGDGVNPGENLRLEREPEMDEIIASLSERNLNKYGEIVFCGYGEATERLDVLIDIAKYLRTKNVRSIRLNTNGLSDLINKKKTVPLLAEVIDTISISLNAPNADVYNRLCAPVFGSGSYEAVIGFIKECTAAISHVTLSVFGGALDDEQIEECRKINDSMGTVFRVR